jgi:hypothetical protein
MFSDSMTRPTVQDICSRSCGFTTYMLGLYAKLDREQRAPTEREATEIAEQLEAIQQAAQLPKRAEGAAEQL